MYICYMYFIIDIHFFFNHIIISANLLNINIPDCVIDLKMKQIKLLNDT